MKATDEQIVICQSDAQVMKIKAFAGTGKTTTLRGLAARHKNSRILYLAFNKAIKEEAQGKFGPHVKAMTAHGLAFGRIGKDYANVQDKLAHGDIKPFHVLPVLAKSMKDMPSGLHNLYGGRIIEAVKHFLVSDADEMLPEHVVRSAVPAEQRYFVPDIMLDDARLVWEHMQDVKSAVPMVHDGYLKMFALTRPQLPYDIVLLDEAQDTNPVLQALFQSQQGKRVFVGDEHQAIYGFRGARNAMAMMEADVEFALTGSFRFGPEIADVANELLGAKGEELRLNGLGGPSQLAEVRKLDQHAYIARSNAALFARAIEALESREPFAFVGPLQNYRFDLIEQTYYFSKGQPAKDPFLKAFEDYKALEEYAEAMEDRELQGRVRLITRHAARLPMLVSQIQTRAGTWPSPHAPRVILTSAHRSKGLEFDQVHLADDFIDFFDEDKGEWRDLGNLDAFTAEQVNLQYVAATRAKKTLEMGEKLRAFLAHAKRPQRSALAATV